MPQKILDPCCGSRMMWFDKADQRVLFGDQRSESHILCDGRALEIKPDVMLNFTNLPFPENSFRLVAFDPPHLVKAGKKSWLALKYGVLGNHWKDDLRQGFSECFRVLESGGVLIFKWNETHIKVGEILKLTPHQPLFGHVTKRHGGTIWITFMKD